MPASERVIAQQGKKQQRKLKKARLKDPKTWFLLWLT